MDLAFPLPIFTPQTRSLESSGARREQEYGRLLRFMSGDTPQTPALKKMMEAWNRQWRTWKAPYNKLTYKWPDTVVGQSISDTYWMFDVIEKAGSTDPEKIIATWEGYEYHSMQGTRIMRPKTIRRSFLCTLGLAPIRLKRFIRELSLRKILLGSTTSPQSLWKSARLPFPRTSKPFKEVALPVY